MDIRIIQSSTELEVSRTLLRTNPEPSLPEKTLFVPLSLAMYIDFYFHCTLEPQKIEIGVDRSETGDYF